MVGLIRHPRKYNFSKIYFGKKLTYVGSFRLDSGYNYNFSNKFESLVTSGMTGFLAEAI